MSEVIQFRRPPAAKMLPRGTCLSNIEVDGRAYTVLRLVNPETKCGYLTIRDDTGAAVLLGVSEHVPDVAIPAVIGAYHQGVTRERQRARIERSAAAHRAFAGEGDPQ